MEVCPSSNVALGIYPDVESVPVRALLAAGVPIALGADDPLLFGSRLIAQYALARDAYGADDRVLAELATTSLRASAAPAALVDDAVRDVAAWLATPA